MKLSLQYINDTNENINAVQIPLSECKRLMNKLKKYEQRIETMAGIT